ncbi:MAG: host specificity factor TipJ family phage tail protein [Bryobacteraceae bacterium]
MPAGLSISEILSEALKEKPVWQNRRDLIVRIGDHEIPEENWSKVRVKKGQAVTFIPRLQDGQVWRTVFSVVIAIAAIAIAGPLASSLTIAGFAITGTALTVATALIAGGIMLAGTLALNALFPIAKPEQLESVNSTALNSINGAQNQSNPFGPIPVVFGTHLQSPYYAAKPYTEIVGDDQYLRLLFCLGYGPLAISDLRIGETPLSSFSDVTTEIRQGFVGDAPVTLYPGEVDEVALSIELHNPNGSPGTVDDVGYWQSQTTSVDTDEISADWIATQGIYVINASTGSPDNWSVLISMRYRLVGTATWTEPGDIQFTRSTSPSRRGVNLPVPRGQYEFQTRKHSGDGDPAKHKDTIVWTALRSIRKAPPIAFPKPLAQVALRIRATNQLSGVINTFNCITSSLVKAYSGSGSTWNANTASQWPPDLFRHVLQGPANARPVPDALIDIANLQDWWNYCVANGFKFNKVLISVMSVYDQIYEIAAAGRAIPAFIDGKWGVIWDRPNDSIVQHFTPRNSWGFQGQHPYPQQPHGWRVPFINETNGYTQDERIVYDDGFDATNATLFEGIQFPGVTDPDLVWKHGRFHIAQSRLRPEKISLSVGWEHLICTRGDRVSVTHDVLLIGLASGRLKSIAAQVVTFDEQITIEAGKSYGMQFRVPEDARIIDRAVDPSVVAGDYTSLTLVGDLTGLSAGNLFAFGETNQESADYRVQGISHQKDLIATLTLVDDAPAVSTADQGKIPPYNPNVTLPPDPFTLPPRDLKYLEVIDGAGASVRALVRLTWQVPRFGNITSFEVQQRDDNADGPWARIDTVVPPRTGSDVPLIAAGVWSFRVRCIFVDGTTSDWTELATLFLQGLSVVPAPVANLRNTFISGRQFLSWDPPIDVRTIPIEIRKGSSFESAQIIEDAAVSPWQTVGDDLYWVTAYAVSPFGVRVYAAPAQSILIEDSVTTQNIVVTHDEGDEGWTGSFTGNVGIDNADNFLRTSGIDDFLVRSDFLGTVNFIDGDGTLQGGGIYWSPTIVDTGGVTFCRISNDWTATGIAADDDFLGREDFIAVADFLSASLSAFVRVRPIIRMSQVGPSPVWGDVQIWSPDVYQGWIFQLGIQFDILTTSQLPNPGAIAVLEGWIWTIDVPDRFDSYQSLTVPSGTGLAITFQPSGGASPLPFNGGINAEPLPHLTPSIENPNAGDLVTWTDLTLSGVTLKVMNSGISVGGSNVNLLVRGY